MTFGSRLVIPGTIFGSSFLAIFLLMVTAGAVYPPASLAVQPALQSAILSASAGLSNPPAQESANAPAAQDFAQAQSEPVDCSVSLNFPSEILQWCGWITSYASQRSLPVDLVAALIWQESGGNPLAYSKSGAVGLMQVMPRDGLSAGFMCQSGPCFSNRPTIAELQDPEFNISYGTKMLSELVSKKGDLREALKAYGPMNVGYYYADKVLGIYRNYGK